MRRFATLLGDNNHTHRIIDILKIDVEGSEFETIPDMLRTGTLENVRQLLLEIHNFLGYNLREYYSIYWLLHSYGFVSVAVEEWPSTCTKINEKGEHEIFCFIFTLVNKRFLEL
ncbi:hypothetical protein QYM36_014869 [Artemia franciscana]|uniref:Methyltransferase FkbM domain-containing protein n=1 Tax=Artemia franciscana TaxID=6661 RepID=A0AA88HDD4_ARTSF|nr:hypothetical protein QYM36_014869 [Artemia franciscana]